MHQWVFHKEREPKSVNEKDARIMLETLQWFDNPEFKLNEYQKKFKGLMDKHAKLKDEKHERSDKKSKRRNS